MRASENSGIRYSSKLTVNSFKLNRVCQKAAVHADVGPGNEARRLVAGQEKRRADKFLTASETAHRRVAENSLGARGRCAIIVKQQLAILLCWEKTGADRVDADAFGGPIAGQ